jgi:hypothetical protein
MTNFWQSKAYEPFSPPCNIRQTYNFPIDNLHVCQRPGAISKAKSANNTYPGTISKGEPSSTTLNNNSGTSKGACSANSINCASSHCIAQTHQTTF